MTVGYHIIAEFRGCRPAPLKKVCFVKPVLEKAVKESGLTKLYSKYHQFKPFGVTGFVLLSESHVSVHTWPEKGYVAVDVFTCGPPKKAKKALALLEAGFKPGRLKKREFGCSE